MADINLLPVEEKAQERFINFQKKLSLASIILLVVTAVFTLVTLVFFTTLASKRNQLVAAAEDASGKIDGLKATEELIVVVKAKASSANKILSTRINHPEIFGKFSELVPQNVYFTDLRFSSTKLIMSGKAKTSADIAGLVSSFLSQKGSEIISGVIVDSLSSNETGVYQFAISAQLAGK